MTFKATTFTTTQRWMFALTASLVPMLASIIGGIILTRQQHPAFHDPAIASDMPQTHDLWLVLPLALGFVVIRTVLVNVFEPLARLALPPTFKNNHYRVNRFATSMFKCLHFVIATIVGYWILKDEPWFPTSLGGSGDVSVVLPSAVQPTLATLQWYLLVELAYQTQSLVFVLFCKPFDGDTMDFVAHDLISMVLMGNAYLINHICIASIITFLNDACDLVQYAYFMATDSHRKAILAPMYLIFLVVWWYTRLHVFPCDCLHWIILVLPSADPYSSMFSLYPTNIMLSLLLGLQMYWYVVLVIKGARMLFVANKPIDPVAKKQI